MKVKDLIAALSILDQEKTVVVGDLISSTAVEVKETKLFHMDAKPEEVVRISVRIPALKRKA